MPRPLIGITPTPTTDTLAHGTFTRFVLNSAYADAITAAGGVPVVLPYATENVAALAERLDGLLFSGGADIDPARYGDDTVHPTTYDISAERDAFEFRLLQEALAADLPVLCICRGIQVLNVALGGTLYQDIPTQYAATLEHRQQKAGISAEQPGHAVALEPGSILADALDRSELPVNSFHHQAIKELAPDLRPIATAPDGLIEAVSLPSHSFVLGVQWHPELMFRAAPAQHVPFQLLTAAALTASALPLGTHR